MTLYQKKIKNLIKPFLIIPIQGALKSKETMKSRIILSTLLLIFVASFSAKAQDNQNIRQKRLQKRENVNSNRQERIDKRNPNGIGRVDDRVERRGNRIDRKQKRTDRRVNRRRGN